VQHYKQSQQTQIKKYAAKHRVFKNIDYECFGRSFIKAVFSLDFKGFYGIKN
jgi:hypothetical protein